ncbi:hypothetical protein [Methanobrevibacter filiformis]|uniref:Alpha/beta hydrolase family protein n=1 Tax=Methanobrevibacter filiformis TaxID=55758 RepID=A0A162FIV0_9EURY|nr:hypothetical protein [Methanobrevibacter filiformis]KZX13685.1 hypothetical protein MBFIL_09810 [Methanobrevibacter filiformis]
MDRLVKNIIKLNVEEIATFDFPEDEFFGLEIIEKKVKYDFLLRFSSKNDKLLCLGSSVGSKRYNIEPPIFTRQSWQNRFEESVIYYSDPSFYINKDIRTAWYIGTSDTWYIEKISEIIKNIMNNRKIQPENTLFYGTSAGGVSAVQLATFIKKSTALAGNFQSRVKYFKNISHYLHVINYCFKGINEETVLKEYGERFDMIRFFKKEKYVPPIIYYVNAYSENDLTEQCIPFIKGLGQLPNIDNDVEILIYHDENGHSSRIGLNEALPLIKGVLDRKIYKYYDTFSVPSLTLKKVKKQNLNLKNKVLDLERENQELETLLGQRIKDNIKIYLMLKFRKLFYRIKKMSRYEDIEEKVRGITKISILRKIKSYILRRFARLIYKIKNTFK